MYYAVFSGYKSKKLGAKTICNMMGVSVPAVSDLKDERLTRAIALINGAVEDMTGLSVPSVSDLKDEIEETKGKRPALLDSNKPDVKIDKFNEKDYVSYGSW